MSEEERKMLLLLAEARKFISSGQNDFICNAIRRADGGGNIDMSGRTSAPCDRLLRYIRRSLGEHQMLDTWLRREVGVIDIDILIGDGKLRTTRLNWIDAMIRAIENGEEVKPL
jgi:hypothetical protein